MVFCGDFNSLPGESAYCFARYGAINAQPTTSDGSQSNTPHLLLHNDLNKVYSAHVDLGYIDSMN